MPRLLDNLCLYTSAPSILASCLMLTACAGTVEQVQLGVTGSTPALRGSPAAVYSRVARGILGCWFTGSGGMRNAYVFHGEVPPGDKPARAVIVLHERDDRSANPRGLEAMKITIEPVSETSSMLAFESRRFIGEQRKAMEAAVNRWAKGDGSCGETIATGWEAQPVAEPIKGKAKAKAKPTAKPKPKAKASAAAKSEAKAKPAPVTGAMPSAKSG